MTVGLYFPDFQGDFQTELFTSKVMRVAAKRSESKYKWLDDPQVLELNQSNAHSDRVYAATRGRRETTSSLKQSLNGTYCLFAKSFGTSKTFL